MKVPYATGGGVTFFREMTDGETWMSHPRGRGIIVVHPDRQPLWCHADEYGAVRQEVIEPGGQS